jgi:glyoxylase-like metal-dependent hydrolase (beta-lactamase superfamily II)
VLTAVHTPGHSPDHLCFWEADGRQLFCGDLAWKGSTVVIPPSHGGDVAEYLASLERVIRLAPAVMLPAHGDVIDRPIELLREYIGHRMLRERQVIEALRRGISDPMDIVARIYPSLAAPLAPVARESVVAHLLKLEREGRARRDGDAWHMIEP